MSLGGIIAGAAGGLATAGIRQAQAQQKFNLDEETAALAEARSLRLEEMKYNRGVERKAKMASDVDSAVEERISKETVPDEQFSDAPVGVIAGARKLPKSFSAAEKAQMKAEEARRLGGDSTDYERDRTFASNEDKEAYGRTKDQRDFDQRVKSDADTADYRNKSLALSQSAEGRARREDERKNDPAGRSMLAEGLTLIQQGDKEAGLKSLTVSAVHYGNPEAMTQLTKLANNGIVDKSTVAQLAAQWGKVAEDPMASDEDKTFARNQQRSLLGSASEGRIQKSNSGTLPGDKQTVGTGAPTKIVDGKTYVKVPGGWQKQ